MGLDVQNKVGFRADFGVRVFAYNVVGVGIRAYWVLRQRAINMALVGVDCSEVVVFL